MCKTSYILRDRDSEIPVETVKYKNESFDATILYSGTTSQPRTLFINIRHLHAAEADIETPMVESLVVRFYPEVDPFLFLNGTVMEEAVTCSLPSIDFHIIFRNNQPVPVNVLLELPGPRIAQWTLCAGDQLSSLLLNNGTREFIIDNQLNQTLPNGQPLCGAETFQEIVSGMILPNP